MYVSEGGGRESEGGDLGWVRIHEIEREGSIFVFAMFVHFLQYIRFSGESDKEEG